MLARTAKLYSIMKQHCSKFAINNTNRLISPQFKYVTSAYIVRHLPSYTRYHELTWRPESRKHCVTHDCHGCTCGHFEFKYLLWAQLFCEGFFVSALFLFCGFSCCILSLFKLNHCLLFFVTVCLWVYCDYYFSWEQLAPNWMFDSSTDRALHWYHKGLDSNPIQPWIFSGLLCLKCGIACNDHINLV